MVNDNPKFILDFAKPDILKKRRRQRKVFGFPGTFFISGNNKSFIYADANDKRYFLTLLSELQDIQDFSLLFHVLMDNHYHLALQTGTNPDSAPINQIMHQLNITYSRYYNKLYSRVNTIYGGRYTSKLILDDQHFYRLLRYCKFR